MQYHKYTKPAEAGQLVEFTEANKEQFDKDCHERENTQRINEDVSIKAHRCTCMKGEYVMHGWQTHTTEIKGCPIHNEIG